jgi:hypothetical protein
MAGSASFFGIIEIAGKRNEPLVCKVLDGSAAVSPVADRAVVGGKRVARDKTRLPIRVTDEAGIEHSRLGLLFLSTCAAEQQQAACQ